VVMAIKKGGDIAASVPNLDPPLPIHIQPVHSILLGGLPLFFAFFYAAGLIGWAIMFACGAPVRTAWTICPPDKNSRIETAFPYSRW